MDINQIIATELKLNKESVNQAITLLDEGNTVPFIARYRKEVTGGLTDENLRQLEERLIALRNLEDRKKTVFKTLDDLKVERIYTARINQRDSPAPQRPSKRD